MPTCPDCGSIIMKGDPYCSHCGAHLTWSDEGYGQPTRNFRDDSKPDKEKIDDIIRSINIDRHSRIVLKNRVMSYLNAKDCNSLRMIEGNGDYLFVFERKNEFVETRDEFIYVPDYGNDSRVFFGCETHHFHTKLIENPKFKEIIRKTGFEFRGCRGGYATDYDFRSDEYMLKDEIDILVYFRIDEKRYRYYHLDLERMRLKDDYHDYEME